MSISAPDDSQCVKESNVFVTFECVCMLEFDISWCFACFVVPA